MSGKPTQDEVVRLLDGAYDSSRMPTYGGEEFLAEVEARALSGWLIRGAVAAGIVILIVLGVIGYRLATSPPALPDESPMLEDPESVQSPARLGDRARMFESG